MPNTFAPPGIEPVTFALCPTTLQTWLSNPPGWTFLKVAMSFRLAPSDLTLDDFEGSKIKVILFDVKYVKNGNSYDVGPNGDYTECPWSSFGWPWEVKGQGHNPLIRNILKTVTNTKLDPKEHICTIRPTRSLSISAVRLTLDHLQGSKNQGHIFDVKYVKNGKNYDIGPMNFTLDDLGRLKAKIWQTGERRRLACAWGYTLVRITVLACFFFLLLSPLSHQGLRSHLLPGNKRDRISTLPQCAFSATWRILVLVWGIKHFSQRPPIRYSSKLYL